MQIIIERGVPLPPRSFRGGRREGPICKALRQMQPGDCVVLPIPQNIASGFAATVSKTSTAKFATRKIDATSCRVWRLPDAELSA